MGSSVGRSIDHGYGNNEGYQLGYDLGTGYITEEGKDYLRLEVCSSGVFQMGSFLEILGKFHWERYLVQLVDLGEAPLMAVQTVRILEELRYVIIVVSKIGNLMEILGKVHWGI